jgi:hypothetical protein
VPCGSARAIWECFWRGGWYGTREGGRAKKRPGEIDCPGPQDPPDAGEYRRRGRRCQGRLGGSSHGRPGASPGPAGYGVAAITREARGIPRAGRLRGCSDHTAGPGHPPGRSQAGAAVSRGVWGFVTRQARGIPRAGRLRGRSDHTAGPGYPPGRRARDLQLSHGRPGASPGPAGSRFAVITRQGRGIPRPGEQRLRVFWLERRGLGCGQTLRLRRQQNKQPVPPSLLSGDRRLATSQAPKRLGWLVKMAWLVR